jgi:hypothetical protein
MFDREQHETQHADCNTGWASDDYVMKSNAQNSNQRRKLVFTQMAKFNLVQSEGKL